MSKGTKTKNELRDLIRAEIAKRPNLWLISDVEIREDTKLGWEARLMINVPVSPAAEANEIVRAIRAKYDLAT